VFGERPKSRRRRSVPSLSTTASKTNRHVWLGASRTSKRPAISIWRLRSCRPLTGKLASGSRAPKAPDTKLRLADITDKVVVTIHSELSADDATEILLTEPGGLQAQLDKYEGVIIKRALAQVDGKVTHAASLLELRYQSLAYKIEHQHPELLNYRNSGPAPPT
jgi:Bacterial regulatory protein, Fis family